MIYSLHGTLLLAEPGAAVIECGGVGYRCAVSLNTLSSLPPRGSEARLYTHLQVREDAIDLFGFADEQELACFKLLTSVNGVGAKLARVLLSDFTADRLALAVAAEDAKALTRSAGVGNKLAQRIVLELKDKLGGVGGKKGEVLAQVSQASGSKGTLGEALEALAALGYSQSEAALALSEAPEGAPVEELIRTGLKKLSKFR